MTPPTDLHQTGRPGRTEAPASPWRRYVAIGDSFSEGMSDPHPTEPNTYVGWTDRLAAHLASHAAQTTGSETFGYANLAIRGRLLADIAGPQVEAALELRPDLVSIVGGGNDLLRPRADLDALAATLESAVARLRASGADVLMATPADPRDAPMLRHTRGRVGTTTAHIWTIARRHGAMVLDQWGMDELKDWRLWAPDRIHLTSEGHRLVALAAASALRLSAPAADPVPGVTPAAPLSRADAARANLRWTKEYVGPWVERRLRGRSSGDGISPKRPTVDPLEE